MAKLIKLTKREIERIAPPQYGKRDTYHFDGVPSLQLRVTSSGSKAFSVFKRVKGGKPERVTIGQFPAITPEHAKREAMGHISDLAQGKSVASVARAARQEMTLGEMFAEYLDRHALPHGKKTVADMRDNFRRYLSQWEHRKLSDITKSDVQKLHSKLGREIGSHTANRTLELLRATINKGIAWGLVKENPANGIEKFRLKSRERFLHADELPRFFRALADEQNEDIRDYVLISLLTGARKANVLAMTWEEVNLERAEWQIPETKNGESQTVHLSPEALEVLRHRAELNDVGYVFPGSGRLGYLSDPKKGWKRILARGEITDLRMHDLRRTLGSWQAKTGASLVIIGKSLNHKTQATTAIYARLDLDPVRDSVNTATTAMMTAAGIKDAGNVMKFNRKKG